MHSAEAARQLILEMTALATEIEEIQETEDGVWGFGLSDGSVMACAWADNPPRLVLTFFLGQPPDEKRLAACELLLTFNQLSAETGGVRGAMAEEDQFTLIHDLHADHLTPSGLRKTLMNFAEFGRQWRRTLHGEGQPGALSSMTP